MECAASPRLCLEFHGHILQSLNLAPGACGLWVGPGLPEAENESQGEWAGENATGQTWGHISACGEERALTGSPGPLLPCPSWSRDAVLSPPKKCTLSGERVWWESFTPRIPHMFTVCRAPCYTLKTLRGFDRPCLARCSRQIGSAKGCCRG